jgi:deazaflavin-dependent oxidoreductase (nitroreductase family)
MNKAARASPVKAYRRLIIALSIEGGGNDLRCREAKPEAFMALSRLDSLQHEQVLNLTTVGRKSGLPRTVEIWFVVYQQRIYLLAEHGLRTHWVRNIQVNPVVAIRLTRHRFRARGRVLDAAQDQLEWQAVTSLSHKKYGWGDGLPVAFEALEEEQSRHG